MAIQLLESGNRKLSVEIADRNSSHITNTLLPATGRRLLEMENLYFGKCTVQYM